MRSGWAEHYADFDLDCGIKAKITVEPVLRTKPPQNSVQEEHMKDFNAFDDIVLAVSPLPGTNVSRTKRITPVVDRILLYTRPQGCRGS